jgi:hypothetical protein
MRQLAEVCFAFAIEWQAALGAALLSLAWPSVCQLCPSLNGLHSAARRARPVLQGGEVCACACAGEVSLQLLEWVIIAY